MASSTQDPVHLNLDGEVACDDGDWKPEHGIDEFVTDEFTAGACHYLAAALHDLTGWPIVDEFTHDGTHVHTFVRNAEGRAVDISGVHPGDWAPTPYSEPTHPEVLKASERSEITLDAHQSADYYAWALTLIQHFPDHFGVPPELAAGVDAEAWQRAHQARQALAAGSLPATAPAA